MRQPEKYGIRGTNNDWITAMNTLRSVGAVLAGFITVVILSAATDYVLEATGIFTPPDQGFFITWMVVLALAYRMAYTVTGGYITAALAPGRPLRHVIALGILGTVAAIAVVVAWDLAPHWFPIALVVTALPCTWLGGKLRTKSRPDRPGTPTASAGADPRAPS